MYALKKVPFLLIFFDLLAVISHFQGCSAAASRTQTGNRKPRASSVVFPVSGNVYPKGYYHVTLNVGDPPKPYFVDIDTGSDLTWLQCDAPCAKCTPAPHSLYKPNKNLVTCNDPLCESLHWPGKHPCDTPDEQCDYEVEYADHGSSLGVLVQDSFPLKFTNGSILAPILAFGCGYNQELPDSIQPFTDGVLGLGTGKSSILLQLHDLGLTRNIIGHCLSGQGGGFLFFGEDLIPSSGIAWTPLSSNSLDKHYSSGPADLFFNGRATGVKGLSVVFDSGSTYSYLNSQAYGVLISLIKKDLDGKQLKDALEDKTLAVCWKGSKSFKTVSDIKDYFKPLVLTFKNAKNTQFQLQPEAYLIVSVHGNACLGILNGTEIGLGNFNVIGDISLQDKMVIYDNEKQQIGWSPTNCNRLPNVDRDYIESEYQPYAVNMGIQQEHCPATFDSEKASQ